MGDLKKLIERLRRAHSPVSLNDLEKLIKSQGYFLERVAGSHFHYENSEGKFVNFPVHNNKVKACYAREVIKIIENK